MNPSSKNSVFPNKPSEKNKYVALRIEAELAEFLDALPNKSEYIRRAVLIQLNKLCPLCFGSGAISRGLHGHYHPIIEANRSVPCEVCQQLLMIPTNLLELPPKEQSIWESWLSGESLVCLSCRSTKR